MADPFIGSITMFAGNFAIRNYSFCAGNLLAISQNQALFSLLGTQYGGGGRTTFAIPELRVRLPVQRNSNAPGLPVVPQGRLAGTQTVTLLAEDIPSHTHRMQGGPNAVTTTDPLGNILGPEEIYTTDTTNALSAIYAESVTSSGGGESHDNMMPWIGMNFIIALEGTYPSRN